MGVFSDGDLFAMSILPWGLSPRAAISLRQQHADNDSARDNAQWWVLHALFISALVVTMVVCLGIFEYVRLGTFILETTCFVQEHEIVELGACSACKGISCSLHPKAMARVMVTFQPLHSEQNVTGVVSHCKNQQINGCLQNTGGSMPKSTGGFRWQWLPAAGIINDIREFEGDGGDRCDLSNVYRYMKTIRAEPVRKCYYNSREPGGPQVWFSERSPVQRGTLQVMSHQGIPLLCLFCGVSLFLATILGCLTLVD